MNDSISCHSSNVTRGKSHHSPKCDDNAETTRSTERQFCESNRIQELIRTVRRQIVAARHFFGPIPAGTSEHSRGSTNEFRKRASHNPSIGMYRRNGSDSRIGRAGRSGCGKLFHGTNRPVDFASNRKYSLALGDGSIRQIFPVSSAISRVSVGVQQLHFWLRRCLIRSLQ